MPLFFFKRIRDVSIKIFKKKMLLYFLLLLITILILVKILYNGNSRGTLLFDLDVDTDTSEITRQINDSFKATGTIHLKNIKFEDPFVRINIPTPYFEIKRRLRIDVTATTLKIFNVRSFGEITFRNFTTELTVTIKNIYFIGDPEIEAEKKI